MLVSNGFYQSNLSTCNLSEISHVRACFYSPLTWGCSVVFDNQINKRQKNNLSFRTHRVAIVHRHKSRDNYVKRKQTRVAASITLYLSHIKSSEYLHI